SVSMFRFVSTPSALSEFIAPYAAPPTAAAAVVPGKTIPKHGAKKIGPVAKHDSVPMAKAVPPLTAPPATAPPPLPEEPSTFTAVSLSPVIAIARLRSN
ncbi:MAG: hypothetical protein OET08_12570, partial [Desulfuromonadales bacterium]|nr:hypothetical protein [Desulfuromonadales bacterium]